MRALTTYGNKSIWQTFKDSLRIKKGWIAITPHINLRKYDRNEEEN